jgi:hypothetical protein
MILPFRRLRRALLPAGAVVLYLTPVFFRMAEGAELRWLGGWPVDVYAMALYAVFLLALVLGVRAVVRGV